MDINRGSWRLWYNQQKTLPNTHGCWRRQWTLLESMYIYQTITPLLIYIYCWTGKMSGVSIQDDNNTYTVHYKNVSPEDYPSLVSRVPNWCRDVVVGYMLIVFVVGIPGNFLVLVVELNEKRKSVTDWFVLHLAIFDILSLVIMIPFNIIQMFGLWSSFPSSFGCKFLYWITNALNVSSAILIAFVGLERLSKTTGSFKLLTPTGAGVLGFLVFCVSAVLASLAFFYGKRNKYGHCIFDPEQRRLSSINYGISTVVVLVAATVTCVSYCKIGSFLRTKIFPSCYSSRHSQCDASLIQRMTFTMGMVTMIFILSTVVPSMAALTLSLLQIGHYRVGQIFIFLSVRLYMVSNCVNPLLYVYLNTRFRERVVKCLKYCLCMI